MNVVVTQLFAIGTLHRKGRNPTNMSNIRRNSIISAVLFILKINNNNTVI